VYAAWAGFGSERTGGRDGSRPMSGSCPEETGLVPSGGIGSAVGWRKASGRLEVERARSAGAGGSEW